MAGILLLLWKGKDNAKLPRVLSDLLAFYVPDKETFRGIEFYLPQFVHLMLHVHRYPMDAILEEFILLVSQQVCPLSLADAQSIGFISWAFSRCISRSRCSGFCSGLWKTTNQS